MKIGQVFTIKGVRYGFMGLTKNKCVEAYDLSEGKPVKFKMAYSKEVLIPELLLATNYEISNIVVQVVAQLQDEKEEMQGLMYSLRAGDKFMGRDGNVYTFVRVKQTRFECLKDGISYTAQPGFIREKI